jgi:mercuric ion transport protein
MPAPAADRRPPRTTKAWASLSALACLACCLLPVLITAGAVGAGASVVVGWLPALAFASATLAGATWWAVQRRRSCSCVSSAVSGTGCGCGNRAHPEKSTHSTGH